jgi:hypothetical protein
MWWIVVAVGQILSQIYDIYAAWSKKNIVAQTLHRTQKLVYLISQGINECVRKCIPWYTQKNDFNGEWKMIISQWCFGYPIRNPYDGPMMVSQFYVGQRSPQTTKTSEQKDHQSFDFWISGVHHCLLCLSSLNVDSCWNLFLLTSPRFGSVGVSTLLVPRHCNPRWVSKKKRKRGRIPSGKLT